MAYVISVIATPVQRDCASEPKAEVRAIDGDSTSMSSLAESFVASTSPARVV